MIYTWAFITIARVVVPISVPSLVTSIGGSNQWAPIETVGHFEDFKSLKLYPLGRGSTIVNWKVHITPVYI
jgi:hypothetical protein